MRTDSILRTTASYLFCTKSNVKYLSSRHFTLFCFAASILRVIFALSNRKEL